MAERDEYLGALQRLKADFDNYRKRVARLQDEQAARAAGDLVRKLLPVLDNLDLALAHLADGGANAAGETHGAHRSEEARALDQARAQILDVLTKEGLERVDAVEVPFDPTVHDAVAHVVAGTSTPARVEGRRAASDNAAGGRSTWDGRDRGGGENESGSGAAPSAGGRTSDMTDVSSSSRGETPVTEVDEVMRAGYRWRGQVLRPAMVRVRG